MFFVKKKISILKIQEKYINILGPVDFDSISFNPQHANLHCLVGKGLTSSYIYLLLLSPIRMLVIRDRVVALFFFSPSLSELVE